jgi:hypothetical protein
VVKIPALLNMATEIKNGLVAFFDILCYRNLLLTNSAEEALKILPVELQFFAVAKPN